MTGLLLVFLAGGIYSLSTVFGANAWVRHTAEVQVRLGVLHATLVDAEVGARGYFLTGERSFLAPYDAARGGWRRHLDELRALTADNPTQDDRLRRLDELAVRELAHIERLVADREAGRSAVVSTADLAESKRTLDDARGLLGELEREEARLDGVREREAKRRGEWTMILLACGAAVALVAGTTVGRQRLAAEAERRRAHEERRFLEEVFAGIEDGITLLDRAGKLLFANANAARVVGFESVEELLAASPAEIVARFEIYDETGAPFPLERLPSRAVLRGESPDAVLLRYRLRATGGQRWSLMRAHPVRDAAGNVIRALNVFRDVTAEREAEERRQFLLHAVDELNSSLDYEATLASLTRLAVPALADWCAVDIVEDGKPRRLATAHVDASKVEAVMELERRYPSDPRSKNGVHEIMRTGNAQLVPVIPRELLAAAAVDESHLALIEGLELRSYMGVPLSAGGKVLGAITFAMAESHRVYDERDLSFAGAVADRAALAIENARLFREVERSRAETASRLVAEEQRRREAEDHTRFADTFVGILGHDLRNPLNAIIMTARLIQRLGRADEAALNRILASGQRMSNMVGQLLDLTRSRMGGGIPLDRRSADLGALVGEVVDETRRAYPSRDIHWHAPAPLPAFVDRDRIAQVVSNLLGNALEHGDARSPVTMALTGGARSAVLTVHNDGPPIPEDRVSVLFEPFRRALARGARSKGLGLGLFITERIVAAHEGRIEVSSSADHGTTFSVVLPGLAADERALTQQEMSS
jgi:PAS domain S-box-containing protein